MPRNSKCWFRGCANDSKTNSELEFYRFPADDDRCGLWVDNCSNNELNNIMKLNPKNVRALRVCRKHFLDDFVTPSGRLVSHAIPLPYGQSSELVNKDKFMSDCALVKSSKASQLLITADEKSDGSIQMPASTFDSDYQDQDCGTIHESSSHFDNQTIIAHHTSPSLHQEATSLQHTGRLIPVSQSDVYPINTPTIGESHDLQNNFNGSYIESFAIDSNHPHQMETTSIATCIDQQEQGAQFVGSGALQTETQCLMPLNQVEVTRIALPREPMSIPNNNQQEVETLRRDLSKARQNAANAKFRYEKLKRQVKGRTHRQRLKECLKICKEEFDDTTYDLLMAIIGGSKTANGKRWTDNVKLFASRLFIMSRPAFKYVRKTIDLPSVTIVKRHIQENKLAKPSFAIECDEDSS